MKTRFESLLIIPCFTATVIAAAFSWAASDQSLEDHNRKVVQEAQALCSTSGCTPCGAFHYDHDRQVVYEPSFCEFRYVVQQEEAQKTKEDQEIRAKYKYSDDCGCHDAHGCSCDRHEDEDESCFLNDGHRVCVQ